MSKSSLRPGLTLVATPIGNSSDIGLRALDALREADVLVCEDTRMVRRLMDLHAVPLNGRQMIAYHDHNAAEAMPRVQAALEAGGRVVYCSDAGTPLVADPGYRLVQSTIAGGFPLSGIPGPCAAIMALTLSSLPSDRFLFAGFAPHKQEARRKFYAEVASIAATLIFYESPRRLAAALADMALALGERPAAVTRELTKMFEEVRRGSLADLAAHYAQAGAPKGEIVVVVGPPAPAAAASADDLDAALTDALARLSVKDAAREVAEALNLKRRDVYDRALALREG